MLKVQDIMTTDLFTLRADQNLGLVRTFMDFQHVRHIPIMDDDGGFRGLLTHRDVLALSISRLAGVSEEQQEEIDDKIRIGSVMKTKVLTVAPEATCLEAVELLVEHKYGCLPVVGADGKLKGIVTEHDFLKLSARLLREVQGGPRPPW